MEDTYDLNIFNTIEIQYSRDFGVADKESISSLLIMLWKSPICPFF